MVGSKDGRERKKGSDDKDETASERPDRPEEAAVPIDADPVDDVEETESPLDADTARDVDDAESPLEMEIPMDPVEGTATPDPSTEGEEEADPLSLDTLDAAQGDEDDEDEGPRPPEGLPNFPVDPDPDNETTVASEYAAAMVGLDPDSWRLERRRRELEEADARMADRLQEPEVDEEAERRCRAFFYSAAGIAGGVTLVSIFLHILSIGPVGLSTWLITLASGAVITAAFLAPRCGFRPSMEGENIKEAGEWKRRQQVVQSGFAIAFSLILVAVAFIELMAFLVAVGVVEDLSSTSITFAQNFIIFPATILAVLVASLFARMKVPSTEPQVKYEGQIVGALLGFFALTSLLASIVATGAGPVERASGLVAKQALYIQAMALATVVVIVNFRLAYPNVFRIIDREIQRSKDVDRQGAERLRKNMLRNYLVALAFVVGSIMFLVTNAAGLVRTEGSNNLDVVLIVYLLFGVLFLGMLFVNYYQSQQIRHKVMSHPKKDGIVGKRRYKPEEVARYTLLGISGGLTSLFLVLMALVGTGKVDNIIGLPVSVSHGTDLFVLAALSAIGPYGFYYARESARIRAIDDKFPDFLRDLAESQRAGMTLPRALLTSSKGAYGPLTKEIRIMAAQVEWGVSFQEALLRFAERTRTPLIERTAALIVEAASSGGNVVDILSAASDDAREIKNILIERKTQMGVYSMIVYIAFFVFLTVVGVLNSQFIPELAASTKDVAGQQVGGIQFSEISVPTYQRLFFHAAIIQGLGGGLVSGVMTEGKPLAGLRHSFFMTVIAYIAFRFFII
ncbi:MAG: type II secretion system F family protein [Euryarchaeota archaeon]|nr:type II secretion system F family protein [Euryarchaeota archaeon]